MELDSYQRCVGGADKKIKFCCGNKILVDLNEVFAAMEANQKAAALDRINRAIGKHGDKDCLLATKVSVLIQLSQFDQAQGLVDTMLSRNPVNPVALGQRTTLLAVAGDAPGALDTLQLALEHYDRTISRGVMNAIRIVGAMLHSMGNLLAARAHLTLYSSLTTEPDPEVTQLLMHTVSDPSVPVLLKHDFELPVAPEGGSWSAEYNALRGNANRGRWRSGLLRIRELDEAHPGQPILRKAIAILENRIGEPQSQAEAWRRYAETPGVPMEEAIEAEAIAMILSDDVLDEAETTQELVTFPVPDAQQAVDQLQKNPRAWLHKEYRSPEGAPPAKAVFSLLDRPALTEGSEVSLDTIPNVHGTVMVYGRETDRDPRVEIEGFVGHGLEEAIELVRESLGDALAAEPSSREELDRARVIDVLFSVRWHLPFPVESDRRRTLLNEKIEKFLLERWPDLPLSRLGGQSPRAAAQDSSLHRALLAWILSTEESLHGGSAGRIDLNPLREKLGLPVRATLSPDGLNLDRLPLVRFVKLDFPALNDAQLDRALAVAKISGHVYLTHLAASEKLKRSAELSARERFELLALHAFSSGSSSEGRDNFKEMESLRETAEVDEPSFLLALLEWSLTRGQSDLVEQTMETLQRKFRDHPGVMSAVGQLLVRLGVLAPDGSPIEDGASAAPAEAPASSGELWTPEASAGAGAASGGSESKLWLPGME